MVKKKTTVDVRLQAAQLQQVPMQLEKACAMALGVKKHATTYFRWAKKGVAGRDGTKRFLKHYYVGREVYTTIADVLEFQRLVNEPLPDKTAPKKPYEATKPAGVMHLRSNAKRLAALGL